MGWVDLPQVWTRQPTYPVGLASVPGLVAGFYGLGGTIYATGRGAHTKAQVPSGTGVTVVPGPGGIGARAGSGSNDYVPLNPAANQFGKVWDKPSAQVSVVVLVRRLGNAAGNAPIFGWVSPSSPPYSAWGIADGGGLGTLRFDCAPGSSYTGLDVGVIPNDKDVVLIGTFDGATLRSYIEGIQTASTTAASGALGYPADVNFGGPTVSNFYGSYPNGRSFNGIVYGGALLTRALTAGEIARYSTPTGFWQLFAPLPRRFFVGSIASPPAGGTEYTVSIADGIYMLDPDTRDQQHQLMDAMMLNPGRMSDLLKQVPQDTFLFSDQRVNDMLRHLSDGMLLSDARYFDLLIARIDMLLLGDSVATQLLGQGAEYTRDVSDGLLLDDWRYFDRLIARLSSLFLYDTAATQVTVPGQVVNEVALSDGLLLDDRRLSDLGLAVLSRLLMNDTGMTGVEKIRTALDGLLMYAMPRALSLELNRTDMILMNDFVSQMRSLLWAENLLLSESQAVALIGTLVAYLVYARLRNVEFLGIRNEARDFLGRSIGSTKWRMD